MKFLFFTGSPDYALTPAITECGVRPEDLIRKPLFDMRVLVEAILRLAGEAERR